jgi:hypothetical protein
MVERYFEVQQWTDALQHENPDLVVLNYGTNESIYPAYVEKQLRWWRIIRASAAKCTGWRR